MKRLLLILVLTFSFQAFTKADDIKDFEIEGMSIGDSLLDYYSKKDIIKSHQKSQYPSSNKYIIVNLFLENYEKYSWVQIDYAKNDNKFTIGSIAGTQEIDIKKCYNLQEEISLTFSKIFSDADKQVNSKKKVFDKTGKSKTKTIQYFLENGDVVQISCDDWSDEITAKHNFPDVLMVTLASSKYFEFMLKEAF